jgi:hypothetical protein
MLGLIEEVKLIGGPRGEDHGQAPAREEPQLHEPQELRSQAGRMSNYHVEMLPQGSPLGANARHAASQAIPFEDAKEELPEEGGGEEGVAVDGVSDGWTKKESNAIADAAARAAPRA